jgi:N-acetylmuramoyl-L-alanine amidase
MIPKRIIVHHTADGQTAHQFDKVNAYHQTREFPLSSLGFYVGYHYLIENDGSIRQARMPEEIGAHDQGENANSVGIAFAGNFNETNPTPEQVKAYAMLVHELRTTYRIQIIHIEPHRLDDTTDCPGTRLLDEALIYMYLDNVGDPRLVEVSNLLKQTNLL